MHSVQCMPTFGASVPTLVAPRNGTFFEGTISNGVKSDIGLNVRGPAHALVITGARLDQNGSAIGDSMLLLEAWPNNAAKNNARIAMHVQLPTRIVFPANVDVIKLSTIGTDSVLAIAWIEDLEPLGRFWDRLMDCIRGVGR